MSGKHRKTYKHVKDGAFLRSIRFIIKGALLAVGIDLMFYREPLAMLILLPLTYPVYYYISEQGHRDALQRREVAEFREVLDALSVSLRAGYSVDNAMIETGKILQKTLGEDSDMTRRWKGMVRRMELQIPVDSLLIEFAEQSYSDEIQSFVQIFLIGRKTGGNLASIIMQTADSIGRKMEIEQEIQTTIAAKVLEQRVMSVMPLGIILYMQLASPGYLDVLYHNMLGYLIMTICLIGWILSIIWGMRIVRIKV